LVDLHSHTNESDGTCSPAELLELARETGVRTLAITDHDTFAGYDTARQSKNGIDLICGIELSTKFHGQSVHLLGYFPTNDGPPAFRDWVLEQQASRRERNGRLAARLRELGFDVTVEEAEALGHGMTGRPHFARILLDKGYVSNYREAFDRYLDESATAYVYRREPHLDEAVAKIRDCGGVASLAHPIRVNGDLAAIMPELCAAGLNAIEAYHSDHDAETTARYLGLAERYRMLVTGGSDFHGEVKPEVQLGTGNNGNLKIPEDLPERLRKSVG
jgi:predicted metal-dependent phosphoesterase TrpH